MTDVLLKKRHAAERRFRRLGLGAIVITALFLGALLVDVVARAMPAFTASQAVITLKLDAKDVDAGKTDYQGLVKDAWRALFPEVKGRGDRKKLTGLLSSGAGDVLRRDVMANPALAGTEITLRVPLSDDAGLYLKGSQTETLRAAGTGALTFESPGETVTLISAAELSKGLVVRANGGAFKVASSAPGRAEAEILTEPETWTETSQWDTLSFSVDEADRQTSDKEAVWLEKLKDMGLVQQVFDWNFFTNGDSREAELAGIRGALTGSLWTIAVTLVLSLPLGVAAAVYLEQFAPRNRMTDFIEVNINNLAAVPSIIFGLLGLAVFLNTFGLPRSAPLVGGLVLALLVLPTIIIASRAALRSVPPSIKEAALGVGASEQQAVFHHILPLAIPGILTGTILGVARALGETAPLLMIGMVAFIADIPSGVSEAATVLPVQIYLWSDLPEAAFESRTAAAILVLLAVLFLFNALAIYLRTRFEKRW